MPTKRPAAFVFSAVAALLAGCGADAPKPVPPPAASASPTPAAAPLLPATAHSPAAPPLPSGHPPIPRGGALELRPPAQEAGTGDSAIRWTAPQGWIAEAPSSSMRRAQYKVPGPGGDAECAVFYFGPGQGGDALANAQRWAGQFRLADGKDGQSAMKTREMAVGGIKVLLAEVAGTYVGGMGTTGGEQPGHALLGAIARGPDANWFFKLTGPEKTVAAQKDAFESMIRSLKKGS